MRGRIGGEPSAQLGERLSALIQQRGLGYNLFRISLTHISRGRMLMFFWTYAYSNSIKHQSHDFHDISIYFENVRSHWDTNILLSCITFPKKKSKILRINVLSRRLEQNGRCLLGCECVIPALCSSTMFDVVVRNIIRWTCKVICRKRFVHAADPVAFTSFAALFQHNYRLAEGSNAGLGLSSPQNRGRHHSGLGL